MSVFNRHHIALNRLKSLETVEKADFLFTHAGRVLCDRVSDITRDFDTGILMGARYSETFITALSKIKNLYTTDLVSNKETHFISDEEVLPLKHSSLDIILNLMTLHTINDLPGALIQIRQALKPDGVFLGAMLGGETLHEIRHLLQQAELETLGGASPRLFPFADKPQMGGLLQRAGFALPVVDSDILTVSYKDSFSLFQDLKNMGETNALAERYKSLTPKSFFIKVEELIAPLKDKDGRFEVSFEIIYLIGWAPHASQQQPLRPGSAKKSLADALETSEKEIS